MRRLVSKKKADGTKVSVPSERRRQQFRRRNRRVPPLPENKSTVQEAAVTKTGAQLGSHRSSVRNGGARDSNAKNEPPTKNSWLSLARDSSNSESENEHETETEIRDVSTDIGNRFCSSNDGCGGTASGPITVISLPSPTRSLILEKENLERELADVQIDRDIMRQQLLEARTEVEGVRTSLRDHISDLEHQLRTFQQSQHRQTELEENALLEQELDQLTRLTKEQEEKAHKQEESSQHIKEKNQASIDDDDVSGASVDYDGLSISTIDDGTSSVFVDSSPSSERYSARLHKEKITELEDTIKQRKFREQILEKEVRQLKIQAQLESQKFNETQRQVQWLQEELHAVAGEVSEDEIVGFSQGIVRGTYNNSVNVDDSHDLGILLDNSDNDSKIGELEKSGIDTDSFIGNLSDNSNSNHVTLLHQQRIELESRVQLLIDEVGTLRQEKGVLEDKQEQYNTKISEFQAELQLQESQHQMENMLVERQLEEWKERSVVFQEELRQERQKTEQKNSIIRLEYQQFHLQVEELEIGKGDFEDTIKKNGIQFNHERGLLKRTIRSLEEKLRIKSLMLISNNEDNSTDTNLRRNSSNLRCTNEEILSQDKKQNDDQELVDKIKFLEVNMKSREESKKILIEQLEDMTEQVRSAKIQAARAEDRAHVLQTFLDASMSGSPSREHQLALEEEYFSVHACSDNKANNQLQVIPEDKTKKGSGIKDETFFDVQKDTCKLSLDSAKKFSAESRARILKMRDMKEQSSINNALVYNLHLQLDQEMELLKIRKQRRRERSVSSQSPDNKSNQRYRSFFDTSDEKSHTENKILPKPRALVSSDLEKLQKSNFEIQNLHTKNSKLIDDKEDLESRLEATMASASEEQIRLAIKIKDARKQTKNSLDQVNVLNFQINSMEKEESKLKETLFENQEISQIKIKQIEAKMFKSQGEKEALLKGELDKVQNKYNEEIKILTSHKVALEKQVRCIEEEKERLSESYQNDCVQLQSVIESLNVELDRVLNEYTKSRNTLKTEKELSKIEIERLESITDAVQEENKVLTSQNTVLEDNLKCIEKEKDKLLSQNHQDHCEVLQEKVRLLETQSKANIENLSIGKERVLEERNLTADFEYEKKLSEVAIDEKHLLRIEMEKERSCQSQRLKQATDQLSEFENEILDRDKEIEKLHDKRQKYEDQASKQLIEMEHLIVERGAEIERLEEGKIKLQDSVQEREDRIEKQESRLAEASLQLSELEEELFAKDNDIEDLELKLNAVQALDDQRVDDLCGKLETANDHIQEIKEEREAEKIEIRRLSIENGEKDNQLVSKHNQLDRQLIIVSKLTEQKDKLQEQLDIIVEEEKENEVVLFRDEANEANRLKDDLNSTKLQPQDDMTCATEGLEQKQNEDSYQLIGTKNNTEIRKLTAKLESTRESLRSIQLERNKFQVENQSLTNRINMFVRKDVAIINDTDVTDDLRNTRERLVEEVTAALKLTKKREDEIQRLEIKIFEKEAQLGLMEKGIANKEEIILSLKGELKQWKQRVEHHLGQDIIKKKK